MPTPIDQLVVVLGLDPSNLVSGAKKAVDEFKKTQEKLTKQNKEIEDSGEKAGMGIGALRLGVAGLAGLMAGGAARNRTGALHGHRHDGA